MQIYILILLKNISKNVAVIYECFRIQVFSLPVFIHRTILDPKNLATSGDIQYLEYFT